MQVARRWDMLGIKLVSALSLVVLASMAAVGCAASDADEDAGDDNGTSEDELRRAPNNARWVYNGLLPHLLEPSIVVSQSAHTARVTGFLPAGYDASTLPFYAKDSLEVVGDKKQIAVVYPIATGSSVNHQPDEYLTERVYPRRTDSSAPWGGFPFISYVNDESPYRGIAFHGPITATDGEWKVIRGPVSHGCNRMQGEHVVELAHLIGVEMTSKVWSGDTILRNVRVPVKVVRREADTYDGQNVDVDYPAQPGVRRPTDNVRMFPAWRSQDFPTWVCRVEANAPINDIPSDYCSATLGLRDRFDPLTGPPAGSNGPSVEPSNGCSSASLGRTVAENVCVKSSRDQTWYRCEGTEWVASMGPSDDKCTERHGL